MKYLKIKFVFILIILMMQELVFGHCQVPCGIYDDKLRITIINEDLKTISKAMQKIKDLSNQSDPLAQNQINRWIVKKEEHAQNIQEICSEYFLTQRIKENSKNYSEKVATLHKLLVSTMKCKQTIDHKNVNLSKTLLNSFIELYFNKHDVEDLKKLNNSNDN
ncbi:MAG: superoxide dismutase [Candidatus Marinimicrobia bacterium]|nr:superoxide dismutase [Candidatus Neomarinimicrobiota bacterium]|tara:strand:+ start:2179 stop:2667 length:489 start_codon:yes stop_codon:yes gene_type:complete